MKNANSLKDLLLIRYENRDYIESINATYGTALGFKEDTDEPAILIFVRRKINAKWLSVEDTIKSELVSKKHHLSCPTDVVQVEGYQGYRPHGEVTGANLRLLEQLHGASDKLQPGSMISYYRADGNIHWGTLGCFVKDKHSEKKGFITNCHVGDYVGNVIKHPEVTSRPIGIVKRIRKYITDENLIYGLKIDETNAWYDLDCAFVEFLPDIDFEKDVDLGISVVEDESIKKRKAGAAIPLDLHSMGLIGKKVIGVGARRACQRGRIHAFAFEHTDRDNNSTYSDYLIANEGEGRFSDGGDSGKLILTDEGDCNPVALLWGGEARRLRRDMHEEDWSYAIDINLVLNVLEVELVA